MLEGKGVNGIMASAKNQTTHKTPEEQMAQMTALVARLKKAGSISASDLLTELEKGLISPEDTILTVADQAP